MPERPTATIVLPTRDRAAYLDVALRSIVPQAREHGAEMLVVTDGPDPASEAVADRHATPVLALAEPRGLNAARNAAVAATRSELIVFVDDDVEAPAGWLQALLDGAAASPDAGVLGGPIQARLEGGGPRACGREAAPITTLDLGPEDRDAEAVWGANMLLRRRALDTVGGFDERIQGRGDEEEWQRRYLAAGGRIRYVAAAGLLHRRTAADSTVRALSRAAFHQGRTARRFDVHKGTQRRLWHELRVVAGCLWHIVRRRCAVGAVLAAHSTGRVRETLTPVPLGPPPGDDFVSGIGGHIGGIRLTTGAVVADAALDLLALATAERRRVRRAAARMPTRRVLVLAIERADGHSVLAAARAELKRSRHEVEFRRIDVGARGKFENLDTLLASHPADGHDWLLVLDDDVALPARFLDAFLLLAERAGLTIAQPAHRRRSHAAWAVTRRRPFSLVRQTRFTEIGPVFAFAAPAFAALLPFPELRAGWGLDLHWSAVAAERGWRQGVVDATPVGHRLRPIAASYDRSSAIEEARRFLSTHPYTRAADAQATLSTWRPWRRL